MKKQNTRMVTGTERDVQQEAPAASDKKRLICTRDSDMPGIGLFKCGDVVEDQRKVSLIADNPNFEVIQGGKS